MRYFEDGIKGYVDGQTTVTVHFPIDWRGQVHIACVHCPYLSSNQRMCQLNKAVVDFPDRYVGRECPLEGMEK